MGGRARGPPTPPSGLGPGPRPALPAPLSPAGEPTFRCDACDELFQSKLDLRRHKKYACGSVGATLYEGLGEELKPEGLGGGGGEQAHECKDCEQMFPTKYRCGCPRPRPPPRTPSRPPLLPSRPKQLEEGDLSLSPVHTDKPRAPGTQGDQGPLPVAHLGGRCHCPLIRPYAERAHELVGAGHRCPWL